MIPKALSMALVAPALAAGALVVPVSPPFSHQTFIAILSGIALTSLLSREGLLGAPTPIRPLLDPAQPYAPRKTRFVLSISCQ